MDLILYSGEAINENPDFLRWRTELVVDRSTAGKPGPLNRHTNRTPENQPRLANQIFSSVISNRTMSTCNWRQRRA
jgi:hypothetical protein